MTTLVVGTTGEQIADLLVLSPGSSPTGAAAVGTCYGGEIHTGRISRISVRSRETSAIRCGGLVSCSATQTLDRERARAIFRLSGIPYAAGEEPADLPRAVRDVAVRYISRLLSRIRVGQGRTETRTVRSD